MLGYTREMLVTANEAKIEARDAGTTTTRRSQLTSEFSCSPEVPFGETCCSVLRSCGDFPQPRFWGVGHLRPLPPATDHATKCSRTIVSELIGSVNTSAFVGTNPTGELITPGLPVTWAQSRKAQGARYTTVASHAGASITENLPHVLR